MDTNSLSVSLSLVITLVVIAGYVLVSYLISIYVYNHGGVNLIEAFCFSFMATPVIAFIIIVCIKLVKNK